MSKELLTQEEYDLLKEVLGMNRFLEILFGIVLFPIMLILGLIIGISQIYKIYDKSWQNTIKKEVHKND